eukprot:TRINITY_DN6900_c0_g1_i1.p1 TRINITY_DN6900_c0_g1~~TRINITY_DN6900_c0_g1_i1.p1  ORF type:complete len:390 (-),score=118.16 TRINITY_DN6900_c0_g1_i1:54-1223(-)
MLVEVINGQILRDGALVNDTLRIQDGQIIERPFTPEEVAQNIQRIDAQGMIVSPGYIDIQLNGGFGLDFSSVADLTKNAVSTVAKRLLEHGVTSFCPTIITSDAQSYKQILPLISRSKGSPKGAEVLGIHLEGPYLSNIGAHKKECVRSGIADWNEIQELYGDLKDVSIITLAPELPGAIQVIPEFVKRNIAVSIGHSNSTIVQAEEAVQAGATLITHLFNAMTPFHHRDPGIIGLLTSEVSQKRKIYFSVIADKIHAHPYSVKISQKIHPDGFILITDAIPILGMPANVVHQLGPNEVVMKDGRAVVASTGILAGSAISMEEAVRNVRSFGLSIVDSLEAATLHPAQSLQLEKKGNFRVGSDADFILLNSELEVQATYVGGELAWKRN